MSYKKVKKNESQERSPYNTRKKIVKAPAFKNGSQAKSKSPSNISQKKVETPVFNNSLDIDQISEKDSGIMIDEGNRSRGFSSSLGSLIPGLSDYNSTCESDFSSKYVTHTLYLPFSTETPTLSCKVSLVKILFSLSNSNALERYVVYRVCENTYAQEWRSDQNGVW